MNHGLGAPPLVAAAVVPVGAAALLGAHALPAALPLVVPAAIVPAVVATIPSGVRAGRLITSLLVAELKAELSSRSAPTDGTRTDLRNRLSSLLFPPAPHLPVQGGVAAPVGLVGGGVDGVLPLPTTVAQASFGIGDYFVPAHAQFDGSVWLDDFPVFTVSSCSCFSRMLGRFSDI